MDLSELLAKHDQGDFLRGMAEAVLQLIMETDVESIIGAGRHERSGDRTTWRNGYRERALDTRLGTLNLRVPKLRQGSYFPGFLEARKTSEQALMAVIQEAWIGGVSTRRVDELVQAMGLSGISKSTVSKLCKDIDERVGEFLNRPLTGEWPYVWLDATYLKVRQGGRIVPVAAIIAVAANTEGRREIIGLGIGPSEAETFWTEFLRSLRARGLGGVRLVISDAHTGLKAAIARVFEATWQRCRVHWMRNALAVRHWARTNGASMAHSRAASTQSSPPRSARPSNSPTANMRAKHGTRLPNSCVSAGPSLPITWTPASTTCWPTCPSHVSTAPSCTPPTRSNASTARSSAAPMSSALGHSFEPMAGMPSIPNDDAIVRLVGALLLEQNDEWQTSSRYMMVEAFARIDTEEIDPILSITTKAA